MHAAHRQVRIGLHVTRDHFAVIHLVDVVAAKDEDVLRPQGADDVQILVDRIGGALVPLPADTL